MIRVTGVALATDLRAATGVDLGLAVDEVANGGGVEGAGVPLGWAGGVGGGEQETIIKPSTPAQAGSKVRPQRISAK